MKLHGRRISTASTAPRISCSILRSRSATARWSALLGRNGAGKSTTLPLHRRARRAARSGRVVFEGRRRLGRADRTPSCAARPRLRAGRTPHLHRPHGGGESRSRPPADSARRRPALDAREAVHAVPEPRRDAQPPGRAHERRRAADADHRPHADGQSDRWCCSTSRPKALSPKIVEQMVGAILAMKKEGVSIVVSEQNLHFAQVDFRSRLHHRARPDLLQRTMAELAARPDIRDARLSRSQNERCSRVPRKEEFGGGKPSCSQGLIILSVRGLKRGAKPSQPSYVLDDQIGFILRQVWQRHATIFARKSASISRRRNGRRVSKLAETGPCSPNQLGRLTAMDVATIKGVIDRLDCAWPHRSKLRSAGRPPPSGGSHAAPGRRWPRRLRPMRWPSRGETLAPLDAREREMLVELLNRLR